MIRIDPSLPENSRSGISSEDIWAIWAHVLEKIARQGGPFRGVAKTDKFDKLVETAVRLFPGGIPDKNQKWHVPPGVLVSEYAPFLRKLVLVCRLLFFFSGMCLGE